MCHEMFQFRQDCCFQWKTSIQTLLKCYKGVFWSFLAATVPSAGCCRAGSAQLLHATSTNSDSLGRKKGPGLLLQSPLTKPRQLRSWLFSSRAYWTTRVCSPALVSTAEDVVANLHHRYYSRGVLLCLHLQNRTWKGVGMSHNKVIRIFYLNLCWWVSAQTHNVWNSKRTSFASEERSILPSILLWQQVRQTTQQTRVRNRRSEPIPFNASELPPAFSGSVTSAGSHSQAISLKSRSYLANLSWICFRPFILLAFTASSGTKICRLITLRIKN